jgi:2-haloacid dehalogenase
MPRVCQKPATKEIGLFTTPSTLIDTAGITEALKKHTGEDAAAFSSLWRDKQLEYSFRRGLMQNYQHFAICTRNGLDYVCSVMGYDISSEDRDELMAQYRILPAFPDVRDALPKLQQGDFRLFAFSNGRKSDVCDLLDNSGISSYFSDVVSTDEIKSFKPNPAVYAHFLRRTGATGKEAWLISGNPFDVIGAISSGMRGAWVKRSERACFDPWEIQPTTTVSDIGELKEAVEAQER